MKMDAISSPYHSLVLQEEEIRLATLAPGNYDDVLVVHLSIRSLSEPKEPEYEALSYVWGTETSPRMALINGKALSIGTNLDCALRHLRYQNKNRVLWVDALCIDQLNILERNSQVQLMGRVYSTAATVVLWFGPGDEYDKEVIQKMVMRSRSWNPQNLSALNRICRRPWFRRLWVVQELTLAKKDPMVYLGQSSLPWSTFLDVVETDLQHLTDLTLDNDLKFQLIMAKTRVSKLGTMRTYLCCATLLDSLWATADFQASDPRDKVYGLLGLKRTWIYALGLKPDYNKPVQEVFIETLSLLVQKCPAAMYLTFPLHIPRNDHTDTCSIMTGLPSWTMDLTITSQRLGNVSAIVSHPMRFVDDARFSSIMSEATITKLNAITRISPEHTLRTVGIYIGTIVETWQDPSIHVDLDPYSVPILANKIRNIYKNILEPRNISTKTLVKAILAGNETKWHEILGRANMDEEHFTQSAWEMHTDTTSTSSQSQVLSDLAFATEEISLFVTSEGRVGTSYHPNTINDIRSGDIVVGLFGANLPFILRKTNPGNNYQMLNIAYVVDHNHVHPALQSAPEGTTEEDVWNNLESFGIQEYSIV
jgi:hypothetical protein